MVNTPDSATEATKEHGSSDRLLHHFVVHEDNLFICYVMKCYEPYVGIIKSSRVR